VTACEHTSAPMQAHQALFYRDWDEYLAGVLGFIEPALARDEPVVIAVPDPRLSGLRAELGQRASRVEWIDMAELGRNPGRIIPAVLAMIERSGIRPLRFVGEPIWAGRTPEEIREATRHEALLNLAWPGADIQVLCAYDAANLDERVLSDAERTHPGVARGGRLEPSRDYAGGAVPAACEAPLSDPPQEALTRAFEAGDLGRLRAWVAERAAASGVDEPSTEALVTAVNELTTNSVRHAGPNGVLRSWTTEREIVFQVEDSGHISDPLAGRRREASASGGLGLWIVNELCDLVEVRTSATGTTTRVHSRRSATLRRRQHLGSIILAA
jgi:anti-sigma regulatory factor (Ser/Thr protein kinase)